MLVEDFEDVFANLAQLILDGHAVRLNHGNLSLVAFGFFLLFDGRDNTPRRSSGTDDVLVGDGKEIALLDGKFLVGGCDALHVVDHL